MKSMDGFVLIATLSMLAILGVFLLSLIHAVFILKQVNQSLYSTHQTYSLLQASITDLSHQTTDWLLSCKEKTMRLGACTYLFKDQELKVQVEDLGTFPCLQLKENDTLFATHHWIIRSKAVRRWIEVRLATPESSCICQQPRILTSAILSLKIG